MRGGWGVSRNVWFGVKQGFWLSCVEYQEGNHNRLLHSCFSLLNLLPATDVRALTYSFFHVKQKKKGFTMRYGRVARHRLVGSDYY